MIYDFRTNGKSIWSKYNQPAKKKSPIEKKTVETDKEHYFSETIFDFIKRDRDEAKRMLESICEDKKISIADGFSIRAIDQFLDMPGLYSNLAGKIPEYDLAGMLSVLYDWLNHALSEIEKRTKNLADIALKTGNEEISENLKWLIFWVGHAYLSSAEFRDEILKSYVKKIETANSLGPGKEFPEGKLDAMAKRIHELCRSGMKKKLAYYKAFDEFKIEYNSKNECKYRSMRPRIEPILKRLHEVKKV